MPNLEVVGVKFKLWERWSAVNMRRGANLGAEYENIDKLLRDLSAAEQMYWSTGEAGYEGFGIFGKHRSAVTHSVIVRDGE